MIAKLEIVHKIISCCRFSLSIKWLTRSIPNRIFHHLVQPTSWMMNSCLGRSFVRSFVFLLARFYWKMRCYLMLVIGVLFYSEKQKRIGYSYSLSAACLPACPPSFAHFAHWEREFGVCIDFISCSFLESEMKWAAVGSRSRMPGAQEREWEWMGSEHSWGGRKKCGDWEWKRGLMNTLWVVYLYRRGRGRNMTIILDNFILLIMRSKQNNMEKKIESFIPLVYELLDAFWFQIECTSKKQKARRKKWKINQRLCH